MDQKRQVLEWIEEHKADLQKLLSDLIQIPSYSGEEWNVQQFVKTYAETEGFAVEARAFDEQKKASLRSHDVQGNGRRQDSDVGRAFRHGQGTALRKMGQRSFFGHL